MINIKELERRWLKYKTKSFLLVASIISILGTLIYGGYYILFKLDLSPKKNRVLVDMNRTKEIVKVKKETNCSIIKANTKHKIDDIKKDDSQLILTPIIPIIEEESEPSEKSRNNIRGAVKVKRKNRRIKRVYRVAKLKPKPKPTLKPKPKVKRVVLKEEEEEKKPKISLKMTSQNYMQIMKEKFDKTKNPKVALSIAKVYFRAGNYEKSKEWALKANSIDNKLEESWLLFAESKQMLGEKKEALKILVTYYKRTKSKRAKELIQKMKTESI